MIIDPPSGLASNTGFAASSSARGTLTFADQHCAHDPSVPVQVISAIHISGRKNRWIEYAPCPIPPHSFPRDPSSRRTWSIPTLPLQRALCPVFGLIWFGGRTGWEGTHSVSKHNINPTQLLNRLFDRSPRFVGVCHVLLTFSLALASTSMFTSICYLSPHNMIETTMGRCGGLSAREGELRTALMTTAFTPSSWHLRCTSWAGSIRLK